MIDNRHGSNTQVRWKDLHELGWDPGLNKNRSWAEAFAALCFLTADVMRPATSCPCCHSGLWLLELWAKISPCSFHGNKTSNRDDLLPTICSSITFLLTSTGCSCHIRIHCISKQDNTGLSQVFASWNISPPWAICWKEMRFKWNSSQAGLRVVLAALMWLIDNGSVPSFVWNDS